MPAPTEPARQVELQPTVATHVSRQDLRTRGVPNPPHPDRNVARSLRPTLLVLATICCLAIAALLVVNARLADVADGSGTVGSLDAARDFFDRWIRTAFIVVAVAAAVLTVKWLVDDPSRRRPTMRRAAVAACVLGFATCTIIGAVIGGTTITDAQTANRWAIASFGLLAVGCIVLASEIGAAGSSDPTKDAGDLGHLDPGYLHEP